MNLDFLSEIDFIAK